MMKDISKTTDSKKGWSPPRAACSANVAISALLTHDMAVRLAAAAEAAAMSTARRGGIVPRVRTRTRRRLELSSVCSWFYESPSPIQNALPNKIIVASAD
jgi:hypothetical protein